MRTPGQVISDFRKHRREKLLGELIRIADAQGRSKARNQPEEQVTIATYREMLGDDEVFADLIFKETLAIPVLNIVPFDSDEKSKKSALFLEQIHQRMIGSPLMFYRDMSYHESQVTGMVIAELLFKKMTLPEFGEVNGLRGLTVGNTEDFKGRTELDEFGDIIKFVQSRNGIVEFTPDQVAYYGYRAISGNPEGTSALYPAHPFWKLKQETMEKIGVFNSVNAAGIHKFKIPPSLFKKEKDNALSFIEDLMETGGVAMPNNWELEMDIPPGHAGMQFVRTIQEICNKGIRKSILYDDTVNAEGMHTWGEAGKEASFNMVAEIMRTQGAEFLDSFVSDQIFRMILDANGMHDYPTPMATNSSTRKQGDPVAVLDALGKGKQSQVLGKVELPETIQHQVASQLLESINIEYNPNLEENIQGTPEDVENQDDDIAAKVIRLARPPKGRQKQDILKTKKPRKEREQVAAEELSGVWNQLLPKISERLKNALFKGEDWKSTNLGSIRDEIKKAITYGGKDLREVMYKHTLQEWEKGQESAHKDLKVKMGLSTGPRINPRMAVQSLQQRVYLALEKEYGAMASDLYFQLESAVMGTQGTIQTQAQIEQFLMNNGFQISRASTVLNTAMAQAYNGGRMTVYSSIQDPFGQTEGSIIGYQYTAVIDEHTTTLCEDLDGEFFRCNDQGLPKPPLHHNCRSLLIPVFNDEEPWGGKEFLEPEQTQEIIAKNGGIPDGFGG